MALGLPDGTELMTNALARLEISRTLLRAGADYQRVPYFVGQALQGCFVADLSSLVLERAVSFRTARLGSLDAIHLATAEPFRDELTEFVTYDKELIEAAAQLCFPVSSPG